MSIGLLAIVVGASAIVLRLGYDLHSRQAAAIKATTQLTRVSALFDQTHAFLAEIERTGALPVLATPDLHLQADEFAILREAPADLYSFKTRYAAVNARTSRAFAGINFYPDAWQSESAIDLTARATGDFCLTNARLLFVSRDRVVSIPWRNLIAIAQVLDSMRVATDLSDFPFVFAVRNTLLWAMMIRWISSAEFKTPALAAGTRLILSREGSRDLNDLELAIGLTVSTEDEQRAD
ncbi:MAG: hypothetical protein ACREQR_13310 [Candidatus Binataceae bacterium]